MVSLLHSTPSSILTCGHWFDLIAYFCTTSTSDHHTQRVTSVLQIETICSVEIQFQDHSMPQTTAYSIVSMR